MESVFNSPRDHYEERNLDTMRPKKVLLYCHDGVQFDTAPLWSDIWATTSLGKSKVFRVSFTLLSQTYVQGELDVARKQLVEGKARFRDLYEEDIVKYTPILEHLTTKRTPLLDSWTEPYLSRRSRKRMHCLGPEIYLPDARITRTVAEQIVREYFTLIGFPRITMKWDRVNFIIHPTGFIVEDDKIVVTT